MQPQVAQSAPQDCQRCPKETPEVPQRDTKGTQCCPESMPAHFRMSPKEAYIHPNSRSTAAAAIIHMSLIENQAGMIREYSRICLKVMWVLKQPSEVNFSTSELTVEFFQFIFWTLNVQF